MINIPLSLIFPHVFSVGVQIYAPGMKKIYKKYKTLFNRRGIFGNSSSNESNICTNWAKKIDKM